MTDEPEERYNLPFLPLCENERRPCDEVLKGIFPGACFSLWKVQEVRAAK